jgi:hypothetical protein
MTDNKKSAKRTYGQEVVGIDFNPAGDDKVAKLKQLAAEMIDIINDMEVRGDDNLHANFKTWAVDQTLQAQMACVKAATYALPKK